MSIQCCRVSLRSLHRLPSSASFTRIAAYHTTNPPPPPPFSTPETTILSAALEHVPRLGFTLESLTAGCQDTGYLDITSSNLFPDGPVALVRYHLANQRLSLSSTFPSPYDYSTYTSSSPSEPPSPGSQQQQQPLTQKIHSITLHRLLANRAIIHHWPSALALLSQPSHVPLAVRELAQLADEILYLAGSTTVTTAWYTDRAGLAAVYAASELFMTQDRSEGFASSGPASILVFNHTANARPITTGSYRGGAGSDGALDRV